MDSKTKMTTDKDSSSLKEEKSQVLGTSGGEMPDPDRARQAPEEADFEQ